MGCDFGGFFAGGLVGGLGGKAERGQGAFVGERHEGHAEVGAVACGGGGVELCQRAVGCAGRGTEGPVDGFGGDLLGGGVELVAGNFLGGYFGGFGFTVGAGG